MSRISKLRESTETRLAIMEKHAFAMETLVREGPEEALSRLEVLKGQLKDRLERTQELLKTLEGLSTETLTGLAYRLGRLAGVLEEGMAASVETFRAQEKRVVEAGRELGAFYDGNVPESQDGLGEMEPQVFMVSMALEAEYEVLDQCFGLKEGGYLEALTKSRELILEEIESVKLKIQAASDDPSLATIEFISGLSADLAAIRARFATG
jgi:ParB-like chromosome segregation protein Spo0J